MTAYVVCDIHVSDPDGYDPYKALASATVAKYGGTYRARGGRCDVLEGDWDVDRFVILEFPTTEQAKKFYDSPEYAEAKLIRQRASKARLLLVEGL
jgi:uncharacterized protein (DUF1330 family)